METSKDFEEFFESLNAHKARYLIVGGYALAIHARPRFTDDLDVLIESSSDNAQRVLEALKSFGFGDVGLTVDDLMNDDNVIQLGYPPLRIDILTSVSNVTFRDAWGRKVDGMYGKQKVHFIGKPDLILSKTGTGRGRDEQDVRDLLG